MPSPRDLWIAALTGAVLYGCAAPPTAADPPPDDAGVRAMLVSLQADLERDGPEAWMDYFLDGDEFFMASEGRLLFADLDAARTMIEAFDPKVAHMQLWLDDVRIEWIHSRRAIVAAAYREVIVDVDENETPMRGYMTAHVVETPSGWRFQHLHWSSPLE